LRRDRRCLAPPAHLNRGSRSDVGALRRAAIGREDARVAVDEHHEDKALLVAQIEPPVTIATDGLVGYNAQADAEEYDRIATCRQY